MAKRIPKTDKLFIHIMPQLHATVWYEGARKVAAREHRLDWLVNGDLSSRKVQSVLPGTGLENWFQSVQDHFLIPEDMLSQARRDMDQNLARLQPFQLECRRFWLEGEDRDHYFVYVSESAEEDIDRQEKDRHDQQIQSLQKSLQQAKDQSKELKAELAETIGAREKAEKQWIDRVNKKDEELQQAQHTIDTLTGQIQQSDASDELRESEKRNKALMVELEQAQENNQKTELEKIQWAQAGEELQKENEQQKDQLRNLEDQLKKRKKNRTGKNTEQAPSSTNQALYKIVAQSLENIQPDIKTLQEEWNSGFDDLSNLVESFATTADDLGVGELPDAVLRAEDILQINAQLDNFLHIDNDKALDLIGQLTPGAIERAFAVLKKRIGATDRGWDKQLIDLLRPLGEGIETGAIPSLKIKPVSLDNLARTLGFSVIWPAERDLFNTEQHHVLHEESKDGLERRRVSKVISPGIGTDRRFPVKASIYLSK